MLIVSKKDGFWSMKEVSLFDFSFKFMRVHRGVKADIGFEILNYHWVLFYLPSLVPKI